MFFQKAPEHSNPKNEFELKGAIRIRKLKITMFTLFLFYLPYSALISLIPCSEKVHLTFIIIYFFTIIFISFWYSFSTCPRCKNIFTWKRFYANGFTSKCLHCGLSIRKDYLVIKTLS